MKRLLRIVSSTVIGCFAAMAIINYYSIAPASVIDYSLLDKDFYQNKSQAPSYSSIIRIATDTGTCSGIVVDSNYAFTAAHCVTKDTFIVVLDITRTSVPVYVKAAIIDPKRDVALLRGDFSQFVGTRVDFSGNFAHMRDTIRVISCGYPYDAQLLCTQSTVTGNNFFRIDAKGAFLQPGQSGGPVFDLNYNLIGVNSAVTYDRLLFGPIVGFDSEYGIGVRQ